MLRLVCRGASRCYVASTYNHSALTNMDTYSGFVLRWQQVREIASERHFSMWEKCTSLMDEWEKWRLLFMRVLKLREMRMRVIWMTRNVGDGVRDSWLCWRDALATTGSCASSWETHGFSHHKFQFPLPHKKRSQTKHSRRTLYSPTKIENKQPLASSCIIIEADYNN